MELGKREVNEAATGAAELVCSVTQTPLQPYYGALSPTLFADCQ